MPTDIDAPRGGRAKIIRSTDGGRTWSRPSVSWTRPGTTELPMVQLPDGMILCSLFTYPGPSDTTDPRSGQDHTHRDHPLLR